MLDKARLLILGLMGNTIVCRVSAESLGDRDSRARETLRGMGGGEGTGEGRRVTGEDPESREATRASEPSLANCGRRELPGISLPGSLLGCALKLSSCLCSGTDLGSGRN